MPKRKQTPPPPQRPPPDPDLEPQPYLHGHDPWRELQPEHDLVLEQQLKEYQEQHLEVSDLVATVFNTAAGQELLSLWKKMVKAMPRETRDEIVRRDAKLDMVDWVEAEIDRSMNA